MKTRLLCGLALLAAGLPVAPSTVVGAVIDEKPLRIIQPYEAVFPASLLSKGVTAGYVQVVLHVDAEGTLVDRLVIGYTHRELAIEVSRMLRDWRFEPARERGEPIPCRSEVRFDFEAKGAVVSLTPGTTVMALAGVGDRPYTSLLRLPHELDQPLVAIATVSPVHPGPQLRPPQPEGHVVLDFFIDPEGRPRMPVIAGGTRAEFGMAAVDALLQWRFSPPMHAGNSVVVRARQEFVFRAEERGQRRPAAPPGGQDSD